MKKPYFLILLCLALLVPSLTFADGADEFILVASTIGPIDAGIVSVLEDQFEKETGIRVRHVGAGTGEALKLAEKGYFDLVMVHAKSLEEKFIKDGYGIERVPFMYNDFVILGPASDPAGIKGMKSAAEALKKIAEKGAPFVSRGDKSGTNVAELQLWTKAGLNPAGSWYFVYEKGSDGNAATLKYTDQKGAYTFMDRATYLSMKNRIKLVVLVENGEDLINYISLIPVNPKKFPKVNNADTITFIKWLTAPDKGQLIVRDFGKDKYGSPLFFPNSDAWKEAQKNKALK